MEVPTNRMSYTHELYKSRYTFSSGGNRLSGSYKPGSSTATTRQRGKGPVAKDAWLTSVYQLHVVQQRDDPLDWKPMPTVGAGCREIRIRDANEAHRVFYVATIGDAVYGLHCFEKKSQRTAKADIDLGKQRYRQMKSLVDARDTP
jgi:phage-related protein